MNKAIIIIAIIVLIGVGAYLYINSNENTSSDTKQETQKDTVTSQAPMPKTEEDLMVEDQGAGTRVVIKQAKLPESGFITIFRDAGDRPGGAIGQSELLSKGIHKDVEIKTEVYLTEKDKNYFVMINLDDGDKEFNPGKDFPTADETGGSYMITFKAL